MGEEHLPNGLPARVGSVGVGGEPEDDVDVVGHGLGLESGKRFQLIQVSATL